MKYAALALLFSASPALAHTGHGVHFHYGEVMAAFAGLAIYALVTFLLRSRK